MDPKPQIEISVYAVMNGNPILLTDPNGDCPPGINCNDPVDKPEISADNGGQNNNRYKHGSTRNHTGLDVLASKGTEIKAMMGGKVTVINNHKSDEYSTTTAGYPRKSPTTGFGNTVIVETTLPVDYTYKMEGGQKYVIKAGETVFVKYSHLDVGYAALNGKTIEAGTPIGRSGATGNPGFNKSRNAFGIDPKFRHTHIESRVEGSFGKPVDPEGFMESTFDKNGKRNSIKAPTSSMPLNSKFGSFPLPNE